MPWGWEKKRGRNQGRPRNQTNKKRRRGKRTLPGSRGRGCLASRQPDGDEGGEIQAREEGRSREKRSGPGDGNGRVGLLQLFVLAVKREGGGEKGGCSGRGGGRTARLVSKKAPDVAVGRHYR